MKYYSLNNTAYFVSLREAVTKGLADDKGLFFPTSITPLNASFFEHIEELPDYAIATAVIEQFVSPDIPTEDLESIVKDTLSFHTPVITLSEHISTLELFHGPTLAFKDVGARFMARVLQYILEGSTDKVNVLVATSGDTGSAVANGFLGIDGIDVTILYPSGKVSAIQEKQLTTLGQNITAIEVSGTFDDCQAMVKKAFSDSDLKTNRRLTSANSINIVRWLPQMFYYFFAYKQLKSKYSSLIFSVPSGNFGNICAGMMAQRLGLPVSKFIAALNSNDIVATYLRTKEYTPKPSIQTISNAMDVGDPSNFVRIKKLHNNNFDILTSNLVAYSFSDEATKTALMELYTTYNYTADPHGAIGYLGAKFFLEKHLDRHIVFLETAHPAKFLDVVEAAINKPVEIPPQIRNVMKKVKKSIKMSRYEELKEFLLT